jgi:hypothetical protein
MAAVVSEPRVQNAAAPHAARAALVCAAMGLCAVWVAAGSTGFIADPLRNLLAWLLVAAGSFVLLALSPCRPSGPVKAILAGALLTGMVLASFNDPIVAAAAVSIVLAALAATADDSDRRPLLLVASAALTLTFYRFAATNIPSVWLAADAAGQALGEVAGRLTGRPLLIGQTFAGIDFLVAMAALYAGWLVLSPGKRLRRSLYGLAAIAVAHLAYLLLLATVDAWSSLLPPLTELPDSDMSYIGQSSWGNALRSLLPWNLPLLAMALHAAVAVGMLWRLASLPSTVASTPGAIERTHHVHSEELFRWGPAVIAAILPIIATLCTSPSTLQSSSPLPDGAALQKKTIVAYEQGYLSWAKPEYGRTDPPARSYGMLPYLVEMLGGTFVRSARLEAADLQQADVLVLIHPDREWTGEQLDRIEQYVEGGGSLLIVAEPVVVEGQRRSRFNDLLERLAMTVRDDSATPAADRWEQCLQSIAHPATAIARGRGNRFGMVDASSVDIAWPARPLLVGRYGFGETDRDAAVARTGAYASGKRLGDLVLAAEQRVGAGRVVVLGDVTPLSSDGLVSAYEHTGRVLGYLAARSIGSPQDGWRQWLALLGLLVLLVLVAWQPHPLQLGATAVALAVSLLVCGAVSQYITRVMPDGALSERCGLAYIDATHLEAFSDDASASFGVGRFARTLMRNDLLPLMLHEMTAERLNRAEMLVSIAPARAFSSDEIALVEGWVGGGGTLVCSVGAEEAAPSLPLLAAFGFHIGPAVVAPGQTGWERWPLGALPVEVLVEGKPVAVFYAAWPIDRGRGERLVWLGDGEDSVIIAQRNLDRGMALLIGDTRFTSNANMPPNEQGVDQNAALWRWLIGRAGREPVGPEQLPSEPIERLTPLDPDGDLP